MCRQAETARWKRRVPRRPGVYSSKVKPVRKSERALGTRRFQRAVSARGELIRNVSPGRNCPLEATRTQAHAETARWKRRVPRRTPKLRAGSDAYPGARRNCELEATRTQSQ